MKENYFKDEFKYFSVVNNDMTTIIALRLSPEEMIAVTDEQVSDDFYDANTVNSKLAVKGNYVALISGRHGATEEMVREWYGKPKGNFSEELENLTNSFHKIYRRSWIGEKLKVHDLGDEEYKTGKLKNGKPISTDLLGRLQNETEEFANPQPSRTSNRLNSYLIFAGFNKERNDMEIYEITGAGTCHFQPNRYCVGGSGYSIANPMLTDFLESLVPEKRDSIPFIDGLNASLKALVRTDKTPGVGTTHPSIADIKKDSVRKFNSKISTVMRNVAFEVLKGEIEENTAKSCLNDLVSGKIDTSTVAKAITKPELLERYALCS